VTVELNAEESGAIARLPGVGADDKNGVCSRADTDRVLYVPGRHILSDRVLLLVSKFPHFAEKGRR
jgi:hypothetical protein